MRPELHAVKRYPKRAVRMQGAQHEAVAAQGHDDVGIPRFDTFVTLDERRAGALGDFGFAGDEG